MARRPTKLMPGREVMFRHPETGHITFGTIVNVNAAYDDVDVVWSENREWYYGKEYSSLPATILRLKSDKISL